MDKILENTPTGLLVSAIEEYGDKKKEYVRLMDRRKFISNRNFEFSENNLQKFDRINQMLLKNEKQMLKQALSLERFLNKTNRGKSGIEIIFEMHLIDKSKIMLIEELQNEPIFHGFTTLPLEKQLSNYDPSTNWNEFKNQVDHPLNIQHHCFTFYHLYNSTFLTWRDFLDLKEVCFKIRTNIKIPFKFSDK